MEKLECKRATTEDIEEPIRQINSFVTYRYFITCVI